MNILSPSILSADFANLERDINITAKAGSEYIHIDVMDGHFVPNMSLGFQTIASIKKVCDKVLDVHLMIEKPERYIERFAKAGSDIITIHYEATADVKAAIDLIHSFGVKAGLVIKPGTDVHVFDEFINDIELALIMTVEPGFGGQKFMPDMLEKVKYLSKVKKERGLDFDIEIDGGVDLANVKTSIEAGANVFVAGSAVFNGDIEQNTKAFMSILNS